ncbi:hypothetical protein KPATCC21470_3756 [Kitasatospora purpeofusca]
MELNPVHRRAWRCRGTGSDRGAARRGTVRGCCGRSAGDSEPGRDWTKEVGRSAAGDARYRPPHPVRSRRTPVPAPAPLRASPCAPTGATTHRDHRCHPAVTPSGTRRDRPPRPDNRPGRNRPVPNHAESVAEQALRPARCCMEEVLPMARAPSAECRSVPPRPPVATIITSRSVSEGSTQACVRDHRHGLVRPRAPAHPAGTAADARPIDRLTGRRSSPGAVTPAPARP